MSKIAFKGNPLGVGTFTIEAPNSNTDRALTLPDGSGQLITADATQTLTNKSISADQINSGTIANARLPASATRGEISTANIQSATGSSLGFVSGRRIRDAFNATGSAPVYACRAWVNFDGTITTPSIRASGNVSSVTRNGTGDYTVNFTTAMPDVNYSVSAFAWASAKNAAGTKLGGTGSISNTTNPMATGSVRVVTADNFAESATSNSNIVLVTVFR